MTRSEATRLDRKKRKSDNGDKRGRDLKEISVARSKTNFSARYFASGYIILFRYYIR